MEPLKKQARTAGILYLLACLPGPFSLIYVPRALIVPGDVTATADHLRASAGLLRMGIAGELINATLLVFAVLALYRLFRGVSEKHAAAMAALLLLSIPISLLNVVNDVAALVLVHGAPFLGAFDTRQLDTLAFLFLRLHSLGLVVAQILWGLWLLPYALVVMRSGFIPRLLGVPLMLAGCGYVASSLTTLLLPAYAHMVSQVGLALGVGEVPIGLWLVIWGAKATPSDVAVVWANEQASATG